MKSLYDIETLAEVIDRIQQIKPDAKAKWGKMNAAQMLEHCAKTFDYGTGKIHEPRSILGYLIGWMFKSLYYNDKPYSQNSPTAKMYLVSTETDFEKAKNRLMPLIVEFSKGGPSKCTTHPSSFFGKLSPEQHGKGLYKHLDHHLQQFGV